MPKTTDGICSQIREILTGGSVVSLEMSVDNTLIRVMRRVTAEELEEDAVTWDLALQAVESMIEYSSAEASPFQVLVDMLQVVTAENLHAICWACAPGGAARISQWLEAKERGVPTTDTTLLGLPLREIKTLPAETLVLCASSWTSAGPAEVSFAVKTVVELRNDRQHISRSSTSHPVGDGSPQCASTISGVALTPRRLRRVTWGKPGDLGERVEDSGGVHPGPGIGTA